MIPPFGAWSIWLGSERVPRTAGKMAGYPAIFLVTDASVFLDSGGGESPALTINAIALCAAGKLECTI